jgi:hypothetical protein
MRSITTPVRSIAGSIGGLIAISIASLVLNGENRRVRRTIAGSIATLVATSVLNEESRRVRQSIAECVRSIAPTEKIGGADLQNQYGKSLRTSDKFVRILRFLIIMLQGFAHVYTAHSQINSRRKESQASESKET